MKKTLLAAFVAALFMTPFAFADNATVQPVTAGSAVAESARTEGTSPPARTFAYVDEVKALIAEGASGAVTLEATCGVELQSDGTFTDVTNPTRPIAYDANGTEIADSKYPDIASAPEALKRKHQLLAEIAKKASTPATSNAAG